MRVVDEGLSTSGKPEVELTGAVSDMSGDVLAVWSSFSCFSAGAGSVSQDLDVLAFTAIGSEVARCVNRSIAATAIDGSRSSAV